MRHRDDGAVVLLQVPFEPGHRLGVQVVRGLVEQQQIGLAEQEPAERDTSPLTTRQRGDRSIGRWEPQRVHRDLELAVEVPAVDRVDLVLELGLFGEQLVEVGIGLTHRIAHLLEPVEESFGVGDAVDDIAEHVLVGIEARLLGEVPDGEAGRDAAFALVAVVFSGDDPQQCRLARTVQTEHTDLRSGVHRNVDAAQNFLVGRVDAPKIVHRENELMRHTSPTLPGA